MAKKQARLTPAQWISARLTTARWTPARWGPKKLLSLVPRAEFDGGE